MRDARERDRIAAAKLMCDARDAAARAGSLLSGLEPKQDWYDANKVYHRAYELAERLAREGSER